MFFSIHILSVFINSGKQFNSIHQLIYYILICQILKRKNTLAGALISTFFD